MALHTPIICSDIQENRYVVGDTGKLFRKGDIEDLLRALQWSIDNPEELAAMGGAGLSPHFVNVQLGFRDSRTRPRVQRYISKRHPAPGTRSAPPQRSSDG